MFSKFTKVHFVGIGGIGMSSIAEILISKGFTVSGSDKNRSDTTERLESIGATVYEGHSAENIKDVDVVVYSSAVIESNPEVMEAISRNIPVIKI